MSKLVFTFTKKQAQEIAYGTKKHPKLVLPKLKKPDPLEKEIEKKVCDHAKKLGCLVYKFTSPQRRSVPDRLFILPAGKGVFFIEFKRKGCKPTEGQNTEIAKIDKQGIAVFVVDNVATGKHCVDTMLVDNGSTLALEVPTMDESNDDYMRAQENQDVAETTMDDPFFN